jgi:hypothetical protein
MAGKKESKKNSYMSRLNQLFFHPRKFIDSIENDKDYMKIMFFYVKIAIFSLILDFIFSTLILSYRGMLTLQNFLPLITSVVFSVGFAFAATFVISFVTHIGVLIFRGKNGYFNTYKPVSYSMVISSIYGILTIVVTSLLGLIYPVNISVADVTQIYTSTEFQITMIASFIILAVSLIHMLYFQIIGLSRFHKISKLRAFFSAILIPLVLIILVVIFMIWLYSQLALLPTA